MKIANVRTNGSQQVAVSQESDTWHVISPSDRPPWLRSVKTVIENWASVDLDTIVSANEAVDEQDLPNFLSPLRAVEKIICVGKNYADHAKEMGGDKPELPVIFNKLPSSIIGDGDDIILPSISQQVDFESELVVVIGKAGRSIAREKAMEHVFGYTIGNDVTARDWQKGRPGGQWLLGKTFDSFAPLGPYIVTADEIDNPHDLKIELKLNGQVMQSANTSDLIFSIDFLIAHVSKFFTLRPGDLIFTGTPAGVGAGRQPPLFLKPGDSIDISIAKIGTLSNPVVAE